MTDEELVEVTAYALANARQRFPAMDGSHNPLPAEHTEAMRLVGVIQEGTLSQHRKDICAYLSRGHDQAFDLYEQTGHSMWLGKALAFRELMDAIENGAL